MKRITWLAILLTMSWLSAAPAQNTSQNPHGNLPADLECTACHSTGSWKPVRSDASFKHDKQAGFVLDGKHANTSCASCHTGLRFDRTRASGTGCAGCHVDVHRGRLEQSCSSCHDTESFTRVTGARAHARTTFPLTGAHAGVPCASCHRNEQEGEYNRLDAGCASCHRAEYDATSFPDHRAAAYSQTCQQCHSTARWEAARFDHATNARGFALTGAHIRSTCGGCHASDGKVLFSAASQNDCIACHRADYERQHANTTFSTNCVSCHTVERWGGATFAHTKLPLTGAHKLPCASCHTPDNRLTFPTPASPTDCVACHRADYDRTHTGSGFPLTCAGCHPQTTWKEGRFEHDGFFPIYSGKHRGKWSNCGQCHTSPGNYAVFTCTSCHTRTKTDAEHRGRANYSYDSVRCLACHPRGD